jgi:hypothetical protein
VVVLYLRIGLAEIVDLAPQRRSTKVAVDGRWTANKFRRAFGRGHEEGGIEASYTAELFMICPVLLLAFAESHKRYWRRYGVIGYDLPRTVADEKTLSAALELVTIFHLFARVARVLRTSGFFFALGIIDPETHCLGGGGEGRLFCWRAFVRTVMDQELGWLHRSGGDTVLQRFGGSERERDEFKV